MIWKGVYSSLEELPPHTLLDSDEWVRSQVKKLESAIADPKKFKEENRLLSTIFAGGSYNIHVVEYGGSFALGYVATGCRPHIHYHVVETEAICRAAKSLSVPQLSGVSFYDSPKKIDFQYDVLYTRTALQYAADWKSDLITLLKGRPTMVGLSHTSCGNIPTYLTTQEWYGTSIPYWFINQKELCKLMKEQGYTLIWNKKYQKIEDLFFDKDGNHDIPSSHILKYTKDLVFTTTKDERA